MKYLIIVLGLFLAACGGSTEIGDDMTMGERGGWSASGKLLNSGTAIGNNVPLQVDFGQQLNKRAELAREFHLNPTLSDLPAKNYTVQFAVGNLSVTGGEINPIAEISWAVAGNTVKRLVSVTNGMSVTGVGEAIKVVVYDATDQTAPAPTACTYDVEITVAPGSRPSEQQPATYTTYLASDPFFGAQVPLLGMTFISPNSSIIVPVPQGIGIISTFATAVVSSSNGVTIPQGTALVEQNGFGGVTRIYDTQTTNGWVPILPQIQIIVLINGFPVAPGSPTIAFSLMWGIDG